MAVHRVLPNNVSQVSSECFLESPGLALAGHLGGVIRALERVRVDRRCDQMDNGDLLSGFRLFGRVAAKKLVGRPVRADARAIAP